MGRVKDLRRKARRLSLLEKRLLAQGAGPVEVNINSVRAEAYEQGWKAGFLSASEEALEHAKEFRSVPSVRKSLGAQVRRARSAVDG